MTQYHVDAAQVAAASALAGRSAETIRGEVAGMLAQAAEHYQVAKDTAVRMFAH